MIKKYNEQQKNVRNNRAFESLSKEIEFQELEIELADKNIREFKTQLIKKSTHRWLPQLFLNLLKEKSI